MTIKKIIITTGGSGGHIIPGLTLAKYFVEQGTKVEWIGSSHELETKLVTEAAIKLHCIKSGRVSQQNILCKLVAGMNFIPSLFKAVKVLREAKPDVVFAMGGFASFTGGMAAVLLRVPVIVHEQNAVFGLANRYLHKFARKTLVAFAYPSNKTNYIQVGNPIRDNLLNLVPPAQRYQQRQGKMRLLILGGSRGAQFINTTLAQNLSAMRSDLVPQIWHQAGDNNVALVSDVYQAKNINARVDGFIEDMAEAYVWADLIICRGGALTLSELSATGVASIIIPYPYAAAKHQLLNAQYLVKNGGALVFEQHQQVEELIATINKLLVAETLDALDDKRKVLLDMAAKIYKNPICCSADKIYQVCLEIS